MTRFSLPSFALLQQQAAWLAPARARLLRRAEVARRRRVLDLACGSGAITGELVRRCGGRVVALDRSLQAFGANDAAFTHAARVCGDAGKLPFAEASFDLVFAQFALLWVEPAALLREVHRVLEPGGVLTAVEPDFGGMIEHPPQIATRELWSAGLRRAGADPLVGRKLPGLLQAGGFEVRVDLLDHLGPSSPLRFDLLRELPLNCQERATLAEVERADAAWDASCKVAHLPIFLITARRPTR